MRRIVRIGHRGAAGHAPENTVAAIQKGIALGVDFVEIDVRRTADGILVALHDETLDRTTNGKGRVDRLSLAEIQPLNAGNGEHIPTVVEVLKTAAGKAGLMLELKVSGIAHETVEAVREAGFKDPVIYASFLHDELTDVRSVDPEASLMVLFGRLPLAPVERAMKFKPSHVGLRHDTATRHLVDAFHDKGFLIFVYTANSLGDIQRALSVGVDGVISNFPERVRRE
ncbi:MAG TPA: glycerophosphodiester phosphodiesterase family protein [Nitrospira sp.]|nr:glycerophosphodiester phosphodiesterase family protein [Nitrospira sp.]